MIHFPRHVRRRLNNGLEVVDLVYLPRFVRGQTVTLVGFFTPREGQLVPCSVERCVFTRDVGVGVLSPELLPPSFRYPFCVVSRGDKVRHRGIPLVDRLVCEGFSVYSFRKVGRLLRVPKVEG